MNLTTAFCFLAALTCMHAQESMRYGLFGHAVYNTSNANFASLPSVPCCSPGFGNASALGVDVGILADLPLSTNIVVSGKLGYFMYGAPVASDESRLMNVSGEAVAGTIHHAIDATRNAIALEATIGYQPIRGLTIYAGPHVGVLTAKSYVQSEELTAPSVGTFENGQRTRLQSSGDLPNAMNPALFITMGLSYDIAVTADRRWFITPEVAYMLPLTKVVSDVDWTTSSLRAGLAVKVAPYSVVEIYDPMFIARLAGSVSASGLERDGRELPTVTLRIEEFLSTQMKPLLPYIFFADRSAQIPARYVLRTRESITQFSEQRLHNAAMLDAYHEVLNVIGRRMLEIPDATITITGCTTGQGGEAATPQLAAQRAATVKEYLVRVWGVPSERIATEHRDVPAVPSNVTISDGIEENRRAEITASDPRILDPIWTTDTRHTVTPPGVRFRMIGGAEAGLDTWTVTASQNDVVVKEFNGRDSLPAYVDWDLQNDQAHVPRAPSSLQYALQLRDIRGTSITASGPALDVEQVTIATKRRERIKDKEIDRYSLIAFGYADSTISAQNARLLDRIKRNVTLAATVHVSGHTDRTGDAAFNKRLSEGRARAVASTLQAGSMTVDGSGPRPLLYNNDLPEGRFYSRTVNIVVETPIE